MRNVSLSSSVHTDVMSLSAAIFRFFRKSFNRHLGHTFYVHNFDFIHTQYKHKYLPSWCTIWDMIWDIILLGILVITVNPDLMLSFWPWSYITVLWCTFLNLSEMKSECVCLLLLLPHYCYYFFLRYHNNTTLDIVWKHQ